MNADIFSLHTKVDLAVPLSVTATANRTGVDLRDYTGGGIFLLTALNTAGTLPTLDVKLQDSADNTTFADVTNGAFTRVTTGAGTSEAIGLNVDNLARYVRVVDTLGGSASPATTRAVVFFGQKQIS